MRFSAVFQRPPQVTATAQGRVNLIGEHTDYNEGLVLPTLIPQRTQVELALRDDALVVAFSDQLSQREPARYRLGEERRSGTWIDYLQGVTAALADHLGGPLRGFELRVTSTIPLGSGVSSSAALEVALLRALRQALALPTDQLDDLTIARLGQRAEHTLVGARVGLMDQMVCSLGVDGAALFIDTRSLAHRRVPLPPQAELLVIHSGVSHRNAGDHEAGRDYNTRRAECEEAARRLGVASLRDVSDARSLDALPAPLLQRARHVLSENQRVRDAVAALERADLPLLGRLFFASHASLRDDYDVSIPEIDALVALAAARPEAIYGARITGGGFGGSVVMLARAGRAREVGKELAAAYQAQTGRTPQLLTPADSDETPGDGAARAK